VGTLTTDRNRPPKPSAASSSVPQTWDDFAQLYPIYEALAGQCGLPAGPYPSGPNTTQWPGKKDRDLGWLDQADTQIQAIHLRHFLATPAAAREKGLRLLLQRHLCKREKLPADRDKIDLLVVQYFVLCAPQNLIAGPVEPADVVSVLRPALGEVEPASLEWCEPLDQILEATRHCACLRDFMEQGLLEQGRMVKEAAGGAFYDPAALISACRFNFLLRRSFIQLLHGDLRAIDAALKELARRNVQTVDCRRAGFSATETIAKLLHFHAHWKPPFQSDYTQDSAIRPYDQLMSLREDLEDALGVRATAAEPKSAPRRAPERAQHDGTVAQPARKSVPPSKSASAAPSSAQAASSKGAAAPPAQRSTRTNSGSAEASPSQDQKTSAIDIETLEEKIWEQLIATPPARGRSMTTVTVENTRLLLSAWEVAAFVSNSGKDSDELRRVIVARALLSLAIDRRKTLMDFKVLQQALTFARGEIPRFQDRVEQFKRSQKTDGAVNLGISLKRLLSLIEEAEQLLRGNEAQEKRR